MAEKQCSSSGCTKESCEGCPSKNKPTSFQVASNEYTKVKHVIGVVSGKGGVGKTTSVGKLAGMLKDQGKKVILGAADTFRAAAGEQLTQWANRAGVEIIGGQDGADPASVVYDAVAAAKARNADILICDTAGRLHNKKNLMEELRNLPYSGKRVPGGLSGNSGCSGWNYRTECACAGKTVCGSGKCNRNHSYQAGRYSQGRYCSCNPV